jgi:hypothetical protein
MPGEQARVRLSRDFRPVETRAQERLRRLWIGHVLRLPAEGDELAPAALAHGAREVRVLVLREVLKGRGGAPLFALEEQRHVGRHEDEGGGDLQTAHAHEMAAALAPRAIAHLIVVLHAVHEARGRQPLR